MCGKAPDTWHYYERHEMDVIDLPFNKLVGIQPSSYPGYLLMLKEDRRYLNHLETVHASALFSLAEATSGLFLLTELRSISDVLSVVRKVEMKYRRPARGEVFSKASFPNTDRVTIADELGQKGRSLVEVNVSLMDSNAELVLQSTFEWFLSRPKE